MIVGIWYSTELGGYSKPLCGDCVEKAELLLVPEPQFPAELIEGNYEYCVACERNNYESLE